ncbi:MAG TPA: glycine betaine ABC transporter substrate-binding protein [Chroococcales cyanobacterium]
MRIRSLLAILAVAMFTTFGGMAAHAKDCLVIGSKRFTESYILSEIITELARTVGEAPVVHRQGLGTTSIVFAALKQGSIEIYPEYTNTISQNLLKDNLPADLDSLNERLQPLGLSVGVPLGFNDTFAIEMYDNKAKDLNIKTISDLAKHPELRLGLTHEFLKRPDGWNGLKLAYNLPFKDPQGFDHELAYQALKDGDIDVVIGYSTDAKIVIYKLRVLEDDKSYFPQYLPVLLYRTDVPQKYPEIWRALQKLKGTISDQEMIDMNVERDLHHQKAETIAADFLKRKLKISSNLPLGESDSTTVHNFWTDLFAPDFGRLTAQHLNLVTVSLLFGILCGVPLGIIAANNPRIARVLLGTVGIIQTIPSLALLAFLVPITHQVGALPAVITLFLYSLLPIVRNTYTGLTDIPPSLRESAIVLGLPDGHRLIKVELPLASRAIIAGIKTSAVINVGTATIAAFIGAGGYGERIVTGLSTSDNTLLLTGAVPAAALAVLVELLFDLLERVLVPAGLRPGKQDER